MSNIKDFLAGQGRAGKVSLSAVLAKEFAEMGGERTALQSIPGSDGFMLDLTTAYSSFRSITNDRTNQLTDSSPKKSKKESDNKSQS